tara:strand:+ start:30 stop:470 length:441 start_codon:yes stop_codon:yes gene_type:complete
VGMSEDKINREKNDSDEWKDKRYQQVKTYREAIHETNYIELADILREYFGHWDFEIEWESDDSSEYNKIVITVPKEKSHYLKDPKEWENKRIELGNIFRDLYEDWDFAIEWNSDDDFITITISFYGDEYEDPQHDLILKEKESGDE